MAVVGVVEGDGPGSNSGCGNKHGEGASEHNGVGKEGKREGVKLFKRRSWTWLMSFELGAKY